MQASVQWTVHRPRPSACAYKSRSIDVCTTLIAPTRPGAAAAVGGILNPPQPNLQTDDSIPQESSCTASCSSAHLETSSTAWHSLPAGPLRQFARRFRRVLAACALTATRQLQRKYGGLVTGTKADPFLLAAAFASPTFPGNGLEDLWANRVFLVGFWAWFMAQFGKIFTKRYKKGVWDLKAFVDSGGMPSSHSSLCAGITTAVAMQQGFGSPLFAACLCFSVIVMYDAMGVRRHAGKQAEVLNKVINELLEDHPVGEIKLKEVLGHTPRQVICGALLGLTTGLLYPA